MGYRLGVDLGTTFTAAAVARDRRATIVPLGTDREAMPTVVYVMEDGTTSSASPRRGGRSPIRHASPVSSNGGSATRHRSWSAARRGRSTPCARPSCGRCSIAWSRQRVHLLMP